MNDGEQLTRWQALQRGSRDQKVLRLLIALAPLGAVAAMAAGGESSAPLTLIVVVLALGGSVAPDSHVGLLVIVVVGVWHAATTDSPTGITTLVVALCLGLLHTAMAAATVAPDAARWSSAMRHRWVRRAAALVSITTATWALAHLLDGRSPAGRAPVLAAALALSALAAAWLRGTSLGRSEDSSPQ